MEVWGAVYDQPGQPLSNTELVVNASFPLYKGLSATGQPLLYDQMSNLVQIPGIWYTNTSFTSTQFPWPILKNA